MNFFSGSKLNIGKNCSFLSFRSALNFKWLGFQTAHPTTVEETHFLQVLSVFTAYWITKVSVRGQEKERFKIFESLANKLQ